MIYSISNSILLLIDNTKLGVSRNGDTPSSLDGFHGLFRSKAVDEGRGIPMTPWKCQKTAILD